MTAEPDKVRQPQVQNGRDWYEIQVKGQFHPSWFIGLEDWS